MSGKSKRKWGLRTYVKMRDRMLEQRSIEALEEFLMEAYQNGIHEKSFVEDLMAESDFVKMMVLCKMIEESTGVSAETKAWAEKWYRENVRNEKEEIYED